MSIESYIEGLSLTDTAGSSNPFLDLGPMRGHSLPGDTAAATATPAPIPDDLQAAIDAGSLLSFVDGVSAQEKDDILFSVQLAQRGASGRYNRFTQTQSWYQKYLEVLENLGWAAEQFAFAGYDQAEGEFRMDQAALAIITAIATQNQLAILQQALKAFESLAEGDRTIRLFDFNTSATKSGNFQLGAIQKADNGALSMALGAFYFRSTETRRRFLFFSWGVQTLNFWSGAQKMTFNVTLYAQHREMVRRKLGASAADFIEELTLA